MNPRLVILVTASLFAFFGALFLGLPSETMRLIGVDVTAPAGMIDIRAVYGGWGLGFACFLLWCSKDRVDYRAGLAASALSLGGMAVVRLVGLLMEPGASPILWGLLALEAFGAGANAWSYRKNFS